MTASVSKHGSGLTVAWQDVNLRHSVGDGLAQHIDLECTPQAAQALAQAPHSQLLQIKLEVRHPPKGTLLHLTNIMRRNPPHPPPLYPPS